MNQYLTGTVIKELREKEGLTQAQFAEKISVSDKCISKWENGRGYPDITLLEPIAQAFNVSVAELLAGQKITNMNVSSNMLRSKFYVCPICGNVIHTMGEAVVNCHGIMLSPSYAEESDEDHKIFIERSQDEYFVQVEHEMTKTHYISFIAALTVDSIQMIKLYPEGSAQARFKISGVKEILAYCNRDGLFKISVNKHFDNRETAYDNINERRELERVADMLFG